MSRNLQAEDWGKIPGRGNGLGSLENPGRKWGWGRGREEGKWPRKGVGQQAVLSAAQDSLLCVLRAT